MKFHNKTECEVVLITDKQSVVIEPNKVFELNCQGEMRITLKHTYGSMAMSKEKIAKDNMNDSLVEVLFDAHKPAYFNIVLDCSYILKCEADADVYIQKEEIRPVYSCSYDRLYPYVSDGTVIEVAYTFKEKDNFKKHYKAATTSSAKKVFNIVAIILAVFELPFIVLAFLANIIAGIITLLVCAVIFGAIWLFYSLLNKLTSKVDYELVFPNFEGDRIIKHFREEKE